VEALWKQAGAMESVNAVWYLGDSYDRRLTAQTRSSTNFYAAVRPALVVIGGLRGISGC